MAASIMRIEMPGNAPSAAPMRTGNEDGPTSEIGYSMVAPMAWTTWLSDVEETTAELRWPNSTRVYHQMRADAQISALLDAVGLPIRRMRWCIDQNGASDEVTELIASDFGLPVKGDLEPPKRATMRFNHDEHLRHSLLALPYGFMYFEQVGQIIDGKWRLRKLAPRMPQSIAKIDIMPDGGLADIRQWPHPGDPWEGTPIPVNRLAAYVWQKEGANWLGRSALRACYKHWLLKDRLLRIDAIKNERFGVGIPQAKAPPGASAETIARYAAMARSIRADTQGGVGLPDGATVGVSGMTGTLPDTMGSIVYHDAMMARSFLAMFLDLAQTTHGTRALGESYVDFFTLAVDAVAGWYANITNEYVIEDMVDWNFGPDETAPLLTWDEDPESRMDAKDLQALIESGAIVVDDELRAWISDRWGVSNPGPNTGTPPGPSTIVANVPADSLGDDPTGAPEGGTQNVPPVQPPNSGFAAARRRPLRATRTTVRRRGNHN